MLLYKGVFVFSIIVCFLVSIPVFAEYAVPLSTSSARVPERISPSLDLNAPGTLQGVIAPRGLFKRDWTAQLIFFHDSLRGLPAFELGSGKSKRSFRLLYSDSALPAIKDEGSFLRANGVNVKENITSVIIEHSTVTYSSDAVNSFRTRTRSLTLYFGRELYQGEFANFSLLAGAGGIYRFYSVDCVLADNSAFSERAASYGLLFSPGLQISLSAPALINRGFAASLYLIYEKIWLPDGDKKLAGPLAEKLENLRFGLGLGWRFNFYE
ncbi:MAG: hypothetical protein A2X34_00590 [Elusimicrobia bacterium GWC2_51_8]|nr:MAG: hypothetical protein A2X33_04775 [Elusimicrobia bacterium GWA2_51_34]OGR60009.1 MAG: hypothetical protein A2X34_00590 [Elusimicrobia bacterium GWC2_51_8]HAF96118.1 hypothetical protein [Elusimicrobiota bacterium]HCE97456.1 hypothetical protein [Elusimicrobiota bacterium]